MRPWSASASTKLISGITFPPSMMPSICIELWHCQAFPSQRVFRQRFSYSVLMSTTITSAFGIFTSCCMQRLTMPSKRNFSHAELISQSWRLFSRKSLQFACCSRGMKSSQPDRTSQTSIFMRPLAAANSISEFVWLLAMKEGIFKTLCGFCALRTRIGCQRRLTCWPPSWNMIFLPEYINLPSCLIAAHSNLASHNCGIVYDWF